MAVVEGEDPPNYCFDSPDPRGCLRCGELRLTGEEEEDEKICCECMLEEDEEDMDAAICADIAREQRQIMMFDLARFG